MSTRRAYSDYVRHILESIRAARTFTDSVTFEEFVGDRMRTQATVREFEIIGEATKRLPASLKECRPALPWREMAGLRDVVIHQYDRVDLEVLWKTARADLPALEPEIEKLLEEELRKEAESGE